VGTFYLKGEAWGRKEDYVIEQCKSREKDSANLGEKKEGRISTVHSEEQNRINALKGQKPYELHAEVKSLRTPIVALGPKSTDETRQNGAGGGNKTAEIAKHFNRKRSRGLDWELTKI